MKGSRNKAVIEREAKVAADAERLRQLEAAAVSANSTIDRAQAAGQKLMKEIAFDFARLFAGLAAFYQPYPNWVAGADGKPKNTNPNFNESKFLQYGKMAVDTALGAASYESPKLSAVMVGAQVVTKIDVEGGLPDEEDGGLVAAVTLTDDQSAVSVHGGEGGDAQLPPGPGAAVPAQGEAEGGPMRKAMG